MNEIKNILLCGLGGLGCICAVQIFKNKSLNLKILVDESRYLKYREHPTFFNSKPYIFDYILPSNDSYKADLVIISTKNDGLDFAIKNVKNFVHKQTIFISLLNGIHSEDKIAEKYGNKNVLTTFYIGHSCIREGRNIYQDGVYNFIIGQKKNQYSKALKLVSDLFDKTYINYQISENIEEEYWKKFIINIGINQLSAVTGLTLKPIKQDSELSQRLLNLMHEAEMVAEKEGIKNHKSIFNSAVKFLFEELDDAKTSMLQDIEAKRKTEVDIFAGIVIELGKKHNILTPENEKIYTEIKELENR